MRFIMGLSAQPLQRKELIRRPAKWSKSFLSVSERQSIRKYDWAKGGIVFFFAVMIAIWLAAAWFLLFTQKPPALFESVL
jgi:hypothetical protein